MQLHSKYYMRMKLEGYSSAVLVNQLFLVDEDAKELVEVTPSTLDRLSDYPGQQEYFEGLGNGCRHFLLTQMHLAGIPQEMIDSISGHRHVAREPEMSASAVSWTEYGHKFCDLLENKILNVTGLRTPFIET